MKIFKQAGKSPAQKEWEALCRKEQQFLEQRGSKKETAWNRMLSEKVPDKLQHTLNAAFEKAFAVILEKGLSGIEKTYRKDEMEKDFQIHLYADEIRKSRKSLKAFSKKAGQAGNANLALSGMSGIGMGLVGVGLPDIPIFTTMLFRCVYEIALCYGFEYESEQEKYFILLLIEGAVSYGEHLMETDRKIESYMENPCAPEKDILAAQITSTSKMLSGELLYMKFLQGIPIVGAIGGAYDVVYMKQISEYAKIKYKKRFLMKYKAEELEHIRK
ncbi:MAG: EcsC family protein [Lachnospiraceae bacterium]|nr:EcsC family protein [Lachnospiraceae bacterium]